MRAPRVRLSPLGMAVVEVASEVWVGLHQLGQRVDQVIYLDPDEVAPWPEYEAPCVAST